MAPPAALRPDLAERTRQQVTRRLMPFLFLLYIIAYIDRINVSFAGLQMTGDLHFSDAVFGFGSGVFFAGYVLLGIPGAILVEKWSARKTIAATMLVWGFVASATGFVQTAPQFYAMRFALGVTEAGFFPGLITYLGHWYRPRDRAKAVALFMAAIPVAKTVAAPISAALLQLHWLGLAGWRWLLILEGVPAVIFAVITWNYLTDRPRQAHWLAANERDWLAAELEAAGRAATPAGPISLWQALRHRNILLLCGTYFGGTIGDYGLGLWLPIMLQRLGHLTTVRTALLTAIPAVVSIPAMLAGGWSSDQTDERRWHAAVPRWIAAGALAALALEASGVPLALVLFTIATCGIMAAYGAIWAMPTSFLSPAAAAAGIGMINSFGNLGGFAGPYAIGWFSKQTGSFVGGTWFMVAGLVLSGICAILVRGAQFRK
ncbi:MAG TPA: MFS transporter [Bryobacteraceae bacterium]|nr:MFS transporter [Bryobacteraceae bacterium]